MPNYIVARKEIWKNFIEIYADSEEDAIDKVADDEGIEIYSFYIQTMDKDTWDVEKVEEETCPMFNELKPGEYRGTDKRLYRWDKGFVDVLCQDVRLSKPTWIRASIPDEDWEKAVQARDKLILAQGWIEINDWFRIKRDGSAWQSRGSNLAPWLTNNDNQYVMSKVDSYRAGLKIGKEDV